MAQWRGQVDQIVRDAIQSPSGEVRAAFTRLQREIDTEIGQLLAQLHAAESSAPPPGLGLAPGELSAPWLAAVGERWEMAPSALKRRLVTALIAAVPVEITVPPGRSLPVRRVLPVRWHPELAALWG